MEITTTLNKGGAYDESTLLRNNIKLGIFAASAIGENMKFCSGMHFCTLHY